MIFVVAFALTTVLHLTQVFRRKTWYFIPLVVGGIFETVGFVGRILSTNDVWALGPYIMQSLLLLLAPALFAASIYIILGRIILLVDGEKHSLIRQKWLTKIFVTGDVISFIVQMGGGGIQAAGSLELLHTGEKVIIVGLFLQLAFFGFFIVVASLFHYRLRRENRISDFNNDEASAYRHSEHHSTHRHSTHSSAPVSLPNLSIHHLPWERHIYTLYVASALIMIRSIFRVVEYLQGNNGYLLRREIFLFVFDALLMLTVMILFNFIHPAQVTDLYQQRKEEEVGYSLNETRRRYLRAL